MRTTLRRILVLVLMLSASTLAVRAAEKPPAKGKKQPAEAKKAGPKITISKETTYVLGPVREDGSIDYLAALNEIASKGVTPQNNAAVLFWQAIGPGPIPKEHRKQFFKLLQIEPLPEKGPYFVPLKEFAKNIPDGIKADDQEELDSRQERLARELEKAQQRPWTEKDYPDLARWLKANEAPLARIIECTKRPRFFSPPVPGRTGTTLDVTLCEATSVIESATAIVARAMLRLGSGQHDRVLQEVLACHRFARLLAQFPYSPSLLRGQLVREKACRATASLACCGRLTVRDVTTAIAAIERLPPMPGLADAGAVNERFFNLDVVCWVARGGPRSLACLFDWLADEDQPDVKLDGSRHARLPTEWPEDTIVDWNGVLRAANTFHDRANDAVRKDDETALAEVRRIVIKELSEESLRSFKKGAVVFYLSGALPKDFGTKEMTGTICGLVFPEYRIMYNGGRRITMRAELTQLAFSLAAYRADHAAYPGALSELVPNYVKKVPADLFTGGKLHYARGDKGYALYSVGPNRRDDGGKESNSDDESDDIVVRTGEP